MNIEYYTTLLFRSIRKAAYLLPLLVTTTTINAQTSSSDRVNFGLVYPLSTNGKHAPLDTNDLSINLIAGVSAEERGLSFAGVSAIVKNNITGLAFAGLSNHVGKRAEGLLFAGFINTYGEAKGMQFAGFGNISAKNVTGAQFAGFMNKAADIKGAQFAGFSNLAKNVEGPQFAGFLNHADTVKGPQFAGFSNLAKGNVDGPQFAGFINTAKDVAGSQFAGFINIAKNVKGAQFAGFINVADSSDYPFGIINIIKKGEKSIGLSIDETQTTLASFRSGGKFLYGILGAGYNFNNDKEVYAFEAGFGAHFFNTPYFRLNVELATICLESFRSGEYFKSSFRLLPALKLGDHLELFGGPQFNYINTNTIEGKTMVKHYIAEKQNRWSDDFQAIYIGYTGGLHLLF